MFAEFGSLNDVGVPISAATQATMPYNPAPGEQAPTEEARRKAAAAKSFIENMYKMQSQNSRERRER